MQNYCETPGDIGVSIRKEGERRLCCVPVVAFREVTRPGLDHQAVERANFVIILFNHKKLSQSAFSEGSLGTPRMN